jgi:hypothetical protein
MSNENLSSSPTMAPEDRFTQTVAFEAIRALRNVVEAYDHAVGTGKYDAIHAAHVEEARKLINSVLPKPKAAIL